MLQFHRIAWKALRLAGLLALLICSSFAAIGSAHAGARAPARLEHEAAGISSYVLPNGMKIIMAPYPAASDVRVEMVVKVGSLVEGYGQTGMAHLLEHMLFKAAGERQSVKADLNKLGAVWNATTTADRTNYFEVVSADPEAVDEALRIEADRFLRARFTEADLASEMTVVRNELERGDSEPRSQLVRALQRQSFYWHGYGRPTIGARSDVEGASYQALRHFYQQHYRPDNAFLVVSGNFDAQRVLRLFTQLFSAARASGAPGPAARTQEEPRAATNRSELFLPAGVTHAASAWKIPGAFDRETVALSLATTAICADEWGSLRRDLVLERKIAHSANCSGLLWNQAGLMVAMAAGRKDDDVLVISRALSEHVEAAAARGITQQQLERALEEEMNGFDLASQAHRQFAPALAEAEAAGDWRLAFWRRDMGKQVTLAEVNAALKKWIVASNRADALVRHAERPVALGVGRPAAVPADLGKRNWPKVAGEGDALPQTAAELARLVARAEDGKVRATMISRKTQGDKAWVVFANDYGNEEALRGRDAACAIASTLYASGGGGMTRDEVDAKLTKLQAQWSISLERISLEAPRENIMAAFEVLLAAWSQPAMPLAEFERLKTRAIAGREAMLKDPAAMAANIVDLRFDNYPPMHVRKALSVQEELAAYRNVTFEDAKKCQQDFGRVSSARLALVGRFDAKGLQAFMARVAALAPAAHPYQRVAERPAPASVDTSPVVVAMPGKPNAAISGRALLHITDAADDFAALRIAVNILGGDTDSRIWARLRESDGLAYSAGALLAGSSFDPRSSFSLFASAASGSADRALAALQQELARALKDGFTQAEVDRAKTRWVQDRRRYAGDEALLAARLAQGMHTGRDFNWLAGYDARVAALNAEAVTAALRKHIGPAPMVWNIGKGLEEGER